MPEKQAPSQDAAAEAQVAKRYFGSFARDYHEAFRGTGESFLHRTINRAFRRRTFERRTENVEAILREHGVDGKHVVDIGCGSGEVSLVAANLGARVTGLDIVEDMVRIATEEATRHNLADRCTFRVLDMVGEPLPAGDVSMMVGVIEYYRDLDWLIGKVAAATSQLMIIVDTRGPWWRRTLRYLLASLKRFNLYYHSPAEVVATARRHSFREQQRIVGHSYTVFAFQRAR